MEPTKRPTTQYRAVLHVEIPVVLGEDHTPPELARPLVSKVQAVLNTAADNAQTWRGVEYRAVVLGHAESPRVIGVDIYDDEDRRRVAFGPEV